MNPGTLVRNTVYENRNHLQVFDGISSSEDWWGLIVSHEPPDGETSYYHKFQIILSSHGGELRRCYLMPDEIEAFIQVIA